MWNRCKKTYRTAIAWVFQDTHKAKAAQVRAYIERAFTQHPSEAGETYLQHLRFTLFLSARSLLVGMVILVHGLFPFLFTRTASAHIGQLYLIMRARAPRKKTHG